MKRTGLITAGLIVGAGLAGGCISPLLNRAKTTIRPQAAEEPAEADANATIGQRTSVGNIEPIAVTGIGLVYELAGTGSSPPHDAYRSTLEATIRKQKGDPRKLMDDPAKTTSLVVVSATVPPGARAGDKLDVAITLPQGSKTRSLKQGVLLQSDLTNTELAASARQALSSSGIPTDKAPLADGSTVLAGNRLAIAEGPLVAGYDSTAPDPEAGPRSARIWGGARNLLDRPYYLFLNENTPQPRVAMLIAERLNSVFHAPGERLGKLAEAKVQGRPLIVAFVPPAYRLNHGRFLLVARQVPLAPVGPDSIYRKQLEVEVTRPESALVAALKLEALGEGSEQALRVGLESDSPWVRFAAAESLAYLGKAQERVAVELARLAETHPALRSHCLTALASQDDAYCVDQLVELMRKPDPELRYGAFVALRSGDERNEAIRGNRINGSFSLHAVAPNSDPLVHVATDGKAEVVLFGSAWPLQGPFSIPLGNDFIVSAKADEPVVTITRVTVKDGEPIAVPRVVKADMAAVLKALGELGGTFAEAVELIRKAEKSDVMVAAVKFDARPRGLTVQNLAQISRNDLTLEKADLEVVRIGSPEIKQTSYDTPTESEAVQVQPTAPSLNRDPGRIFGPK